MKRLILAALLVAVPASAPAQSMNVRLIVEQVVGGVCTPFADSRDIEMAISNAEEFGYRLRSTQPADSTPYAARPTPTPTDVEMAGSHQGVLRLSVRLDGRMICSIGIHEGGVGQIVEAGEPYLRAHGFEAQFDQRDGPLAVSVWSRDDGLVVIAPSSEFRPGSELTVVLRPAG